MTTTAFLFGACITLAAGWAAMAFGQTGIAIGLATGYAIGAVAAMA